MAKLKNGKLDKFYEAWHTMKTRCKTNWKNYENITVCDRWLDFRNFRDDMYDGYLIHLKQYGKRNTTLDRTDNTGNYIPENCRWATYKQQQRNRSTNKLITYKGKIMCISAWAEELGINYIALFNRLKRGIPVEKAFTLKRYESFKKRLCCRQCNRFIKKSDYLYCPKCLIAQWK